MADLGAWQVWFVGRVGLISICTTGEIDMHLSSHSRSLFGVRMLGAVLALVVGTTAVDAKCARLGYTVNDYGKEGPTRDAKALLDKHIASWTAARGIKSYRTGKKDVTCELFLDFGVFDEHTCRASATVCWGDGGAAKAKSGSLGGTEAVRPRAPAPSKSEIPAIAPTLPHVKPKAA